MAFTCWSSDILKRRTIYPKKNAHGFVVLCFVVVMQSFIMNSHEVFIHIHQGCFAGTGAIVRLPQCQWSKPDGYGKISQCITTTKHSKAKTVCIFLGIYCNQPRFDEFVLMPHVQGNCRAHFVFCVCGRSRLSIDLFWDQTPAAYSSIGRICWLNILRRGVVGSAIATVLWDNVFEAFMARVNLSLIYLWFSSNRCPCFENMTPRYLYILRLIYRWRCIILSLMLHTYWLTQAIMLQPIKFGFVSTYVHALILLVYYSFVYNIFQFVENWRFLYMVKTHNHGITMYYCDFLYVTTYINWSIYIQWLLLDDGFIILCITNASHLGFQVFRL